LDLEELAGFQELFGPAVVEALGDRLLAAKAIQHDPDLRLCWCCIEFGFITIDLNQTYVRFHILGISAHAYTLSSGAITCYVSSNKELGHAASDAGRSVA
jgi:hypothetical protein